MIQNNKTRTMKHQFILFQRAGIFYCEDTGTGKQTSLRTRDRDQAQRLLNAKNEALRQPAMNLQIAQVYLHHSDPALASRTWQKVMEHIITTKHGSTQARWRSAIKDKAFDLIRHRRLLESTGEQFLTVLHAGTVATNLYLRRIHHYAVTMHWLPWPVLSKLHWPPLVYQAKRAITLDEHWQLLAVERSPVRRAFYEILWHFGGSQTDMARLTAEDIDWQRQTIAYRRHKSGTMAVQAIGAEVSAVLRTLPQTGYLFPTLADISPSYRGHAFVYRLKQLGITGLTLHSYRYAWAERAKAAGYPERFAMQALGHKSEAVHRAYAKQAAVVLPPLEEYELPKRSAPAQLSALLPEASRN